MVNGKKMMENIKYLKGNISFAPSEKKTNIGTSLAAQDTSEIVGQIDSEKNMNYNESFVASYRPSMKKVFIMNALLLLPIITIPIFLVNFIKAKYTTYVVGEKSIDFKFEFLTTKHNSFSVDLITQIIFKESFLDKWIGTCSIVFYSIGSQTPIVFSGIIKTDGLYENILSKVGIYKEKQFQLFPISFSFVEYLKSHIWGTFIVGFICFDSILVFSHEPMVGV